MKKLLAILALSASLTSVAITEKEATEFLYSTLSLPDRADYSDSFYRQNIQASLRARREMPWGEREPDREFLHFVLPVRINNENLDTARVVFYNELRDRVRHLSMRDAILEVNHWCHEKASYQPSDSRTSSPLSVVSQAIGRCGEESTFTVAALRSVGIPARQIYTPRWAHTDDNHAWVEAWADGKWYFLGACEPEPALNVAWFNDPAARGLLMNTNVTGQYDGPEEVLLRQPLTTRINVTANYAPVDTLVVHVAYPDGRDAVGVKVLFSIYNYAEFFPAVTAVSDDRGRASLTTGLGDMVVWATDGTNYGIGKGSPRDGKPLEVVMDKNGTYAGAFDLDIVPPPAATAPVNVSPAQRAANTLRLQREDSLRNAYIATFATDSEARAFATAMGLDPDVTSRVLTQSRGNHANLRHYLSSLPVAKRRVALRLLDNVSEKDLRDIDLKSLADHVDNAPVKAAASKAVAAAYDRYVLSPRIERELIRPWRRALKASLVKALGKKRDINSLVEWTKGNVRVDQSVNPLGLRMSPMGVMTQRQADPVSRDIFFVAAARTFGIPSRIDPVTSATQYMDPLGNWVTVDFGNKAPEGDPDVPARGYLHLTFAPQGHVVDPKYYSQFSISKIRDGVGRQLEFDEGTVSTLFASPVAMEAGQYIITSGQRMADGSVLAHSEIFNIVAGDTLHRQLQLRQDSGAISVIGSLNAENIYHDIDLDQDKSLLSTTGRGYYILGLISPNHEPSSHALNDISAAADRMEGTGVKIMLLLESEEEAARFKRDVFPGLPKNVVWGIDKDGRSRADILTSLNLPETTVNPVFVIADTFNRVIWVSTGYTIGMDEQLLNILSRAK